MELSNRYSCFYLITQFTRYWNIAKGKNDKKRKGPFWKYTFIFRQTLFSRDKFNRRNCMWKNNPTSVQRIASARIGLSLRDSTIKLFYVEVAIQAFVPSCFHYFYDLRYGLIGMRWVFFYSSNFISSTFLFPLNHSESKKSQVLRADWWGKHLFNANE